MTKKLTDTNEKYMELEAQCETIGDYDPQRLDEEMAAKKIKLKQMEKNLKILVQNPFFAGSENRINAGQQLRDTEK